MVWKAQKTHLSKGIPQFICLFEALKCLFHPLKYYYYLLLLFVCLDNVSSLTYCHVSVCGYFWSMVMKLVLELSSFNVISNQNLLYGICNRTYIWQSNRIKFAAILRMSSGKGDFGDLMTNERDFDEYQIHKVNRPLITFLNEVKRLHFPTINNEWQTFGD